VGTFRTRHLQRDLVRWAFVKPTWYAWQRMVVPITLFLTRESGASVRVSGVQAFVWNLAVARPRPVRDAQIARSQPQKVADDINALLVFPRQVQGSGWWTPSSDSSRVAGGTGAPGWYPVGGDNRGIACWDGVKWTAYREWDGFHWVDLGR
jgi:hypothetical protein